MKQNLVEHDLEALGAYPVKAPLHQRQLKAAIFASRKKSYSSLFMSFSRFVPTTVALVLLFGLAFGLRPQAAQELVTPTVSAQELVSDTIENLQSLTSEELTSMVTERGFTTDGLFKDLKEAQAAADLSLAPKMELTCEEAEAQATPQTGGVIGMSEVSEGDIVESSDGTTTFFPNGPCYAFKVEFGPDRTSDIGYEAFYTYYGQKSVSEMKTATPIQYTNSSGDRVGLLIGADLFPLAGVYYDPSVGQPGTGPIRALNL